MACYRAVSRLIFVLSGGRDENARHHGERAEGGRYHVGHDVAVVILARPYIAPLTSDNTGDRIVDERVEVFDAEFLKFFLVFLIIDVLEYQLEGLVVLL